MAVEIQNLEKNLENVVPTMDRIMRLFGYQPNN